MQLTAFRRIGTALEDLAAAVQVYEKSVEQESWRTLATYRR